MKPLKPAHQMFLKALISHGNRIDAYMEAYPHSSRASAKANACRLLKTNKTIADGYEKHLELKRQEAEEAYCQSIQKTFFDFLEQQKRYQHIAEGRPIPIVTEDGMGTMVPNHDDRLWAIQQAIHNEDRFLKEHPMYRSWLYKSEAIMPPSHAD